MADLPHPWGMYARLQNDLRRNHQIGDRSWGTESGMEYILKSAFVAAPTEHEVDQVIANSRRRERHRGSRREPLPEDIATAHPDSALTARHELAAIRRKVGDRDWTLLAAVGTGSNYKEISIAMAIPPGAIRVKVLRLRASLAAAA